MLYNALIQPHFNYACPVWYPNLNEKTKMKIQIMHNKCIRLCLNLNKPHHIAGKEFRWINRLSNSKTSDQGINTETCNSVNNTFPYYVNEIFGFASHFRIGLRNNFSILKILVARLTWDRKEFLTLVPLYRTTCLTQFKMQIFLKTFKHNEISDLNNK